MPRSSSARTSVGSVYRAGGFVECPSGSSVARLDRVTDRELRQPALLLLVAPARPAPARRRPGTRGT